MTAAETITYRKIDRHEVDDNLVRGIQTVRQRAWLEAGMSRAKNDIYAHFDVSDPKVLERRKRSYRRFARSGALIVALADTELVGVVTADNEVSHNTSLPEKAFKRAAFWLDGKVHGRMRSTQLFQKFHKKFGNRVYAHIASLDVAPAHQHQGIGRKLASMALHEFRPTQIPTAYVFRENEVMMQGMETAGFKLDPSEQDPDPNHTYFGPDTDPVYQYRFAHTSVADAINALDTTG